MKYFLALAFPLLLWSCTDQAEPSAQEGVQLSECDEQKAKAQKDFEAGKYVISRFGMPSNFDFDGHYNEYMMKSYNIQIDYPGCEIDEGIECYSNEMEALLEEKHGKNFFYDTYNKVLDEYENNKAPNHEVTTIGGQIVEKEFYKKNGQPAGFSELYLRASIQDYFIKLCESKVTKEELEKYIDKGITVKVELIEGEWDICPDDPTEMQSRIGMYAAVLEIVD